MRIDCVARYAVLGALAVSLACARNSEESDDSGVSGSVTSTDTGATVRVRPDTNAADTAGTRTDMDSTAGDGAPVRPTATDSARMTIDSSAGGGWPADSSQGGWSTPPDSL